MSYVYRERDRDRDWDEPRSSVTVRRYYIPREESPDRDFLYRRGDTPRDRELVIRRSSDREDEPVMARHYDRDLDYYDDPYRFDRDYRTDRDYYEREYSDPYEPRHHRSAVIINRPDKPVIVRDGQSVIVHKARGPVYVNPRESEYEIARRFDVDPRSDEHYHRRRLREYELSPRDSISQASNRYADDGYGSDDSMAYTRKESREVEDEPKHKRHLMSGALVGAGAAELLREHRKREGDKVPHGFGRFGQDIGAGALGVVAANAIDRHRSKSRHRSHSFDDDRLPHHGHRHRSRGRSRARTMTELGLGAAAVAGAFALGRNKSQNRRRSRSHHHSSRRDRRSSSNHSDDSDARSESHRRKRTAEAGLAGAVLGGLADKARSRSHSRHGRRSRSRGQFEKALPTLAAGAGTAALTAYYEKNKAKNLEDDERRKRQRSSSRHLSRSPSQHRSVDDVESPSWNAPGLIEYGDHPVSGQIPATDYFGRPSSPREYDPNIAVPVSPGYRPSRPRSRSLSRSRAPSRARYSPSSSDSDDYGERSGRYQKGSNRPRYPTETAAGAAGMGYAAQEYAGRSDRKRAEKERQERQSRHRRSRDLYEDPYEPMARSPPYPPQPDHAVPPSVVPPPPPMQQQQQQERDDIREQYPYSTYFPPPPGFGGPNVNPANVPPYSSAPYSADYPPPPVAAPAPQPYGYPRRPPGADPYIRSRTADDMVSSVQNDAVPSPDQDLTHDGVRDRPRSFDHRRPRSGIRNRKPTFKTPSPSSQSKSVAFDLKPETYQRDQGYESDRSQSTVDEEDDKHHHHGRRRSKKMPRSSTPKPETSAAASNGRNSTSSPVGRHPKHDSDDENGRSVSDSDSTINLPDRFDSHGRLLPQREVEDDPLAGDSIHGLLKGISQVLL